MDGPMALGRGHSPCRNDEKEKGETSKGSVRPSPGKNDGDLSRSRPPKRDHGAWAVTRQIKRRPPPITCAGEAFEGLREGERGEEGARTGWGKSDDVGVARWVACRPSEPVMAHSLA